MLFLGFTAEMGLVNVKNKNNNKKNRRTATASIVKHPKLCSHRVLSSKFVTVKRVNKVSQLIVHCSWYTWAFRHDYLLCQF